MTSLLHRRGFLLFLVLVCLATALFGLGYPLYVIRPQRAQGVQELALALAVLRIRFLALSVCALLAVGGAIRYWQIAPRWLPRLSMVAAAAAVCLLAALSRVNIFERMFHPMGAPAFDSVAETKLDNDEKVIAIRLNGVARAYPVRSMAYHHIVNDVVGGVPIVATY